MSARRNEFISNKWLAYLNEKYQEMQAKFIRLVGNDDNSYYSKPVSILIAENSPVIIPVVLLDPSDIIMRKRTARRFTEVIRKIIFGNGVEPEKKLSDGSEIGKRESQVILNRI